MQIRTRYCLGLPTTGHLSDKCRRAGCLLCEGRPECAGVVGGGVCLPVQAPCCNWWELSTPSTISLARAGPQHLFAKLKEEQKCEFMPCCYLKNSRESTLDKAFALNVTNML